MSLRLASKITIAALIQVCLIYIYILKKRELFQDLAPLLWNSFRTIAVLLQVCSLYGKFRDTIDCIM